VLIKLRFEQERPRRAETTSDDGVFLSCDVETQHPDSVCRSMYNEAVSSATASATRDHKAFVVDLFIFSC